jgi:hypothetical protein
MLHSGWLLCSVTLLQTLSHWLNTLGPSLTEILHKVPKTTSPRETMMIAAVKGKGSREGAMFHPIKLFRQIRDKQAYMDESLYTRRTINTCTVCPQSPLGVLKNCGAQTN